MPRDSQYSVELAEAERTELEPARVDGRRRLRKLCGLGGWSTRPKASGDDEIAPHALSTPRQVVSRWRERFFDQRLAGLTDLPQLVRPSTSIPDVVVAIRALAFEIPAKAEQSPEPLARWRSPVWPAPAVERGISPPRSRAPP